MLRRVLLDLLDLLDLGLFCISLYIVSMDRHRFFVVDGIEESYSWTLILELWLPRLVYGVYGRILSNKTGLIGLGKVLIKRPGMFGLLLLTDILLSNFLLFVLMTAGGLDFFLEILTFLVVVGWL